MTTTEPEPATKLPTCACERNDWQRLEGIGGALTVCRTCGFIGAVQNEAPDGSASLHKITLTLCDLCLTGAGGQCHTPGCALWLNRAPDTPVYLDAPFPATPTSTPADRQGDPAED